MGLTVAGAEQAWRKANDGIKTGISIQQEYANKLSASRSAFEQYLNTLEQTGADPEKIRQAHAEQDQVEAALAAERDKKIKEMGAAAATARAQGIDAEIAATKQGYKLLAAQTAGSLAEVEAQRKQGTISDADALERRTALQLADIDAQRAALAAELALLQGRKDSAKEQANLNGELIELAQKRANIEAQAAREQQALDAQAAQALDERVKGYEDAARSAAVNLRNAQLDTLEIGKTGAALGALRQARMQDAAAELERKALVMDGIDLSGRASKALREQAQAMRDLAKVQGYNESARMVYDYAKAIDEANAATQYELSLATMSQRDRAVALEQYRIAIDLKKRLAEIDAQNPADKQAAERLKAEATEAAARAQAGVAGRVFVQEWTRTVDQVDDVFRQGFADMLNRGEDGWKSFNQSLVTTFKTTVANELYKAFAQPFVVNIVGNLMGLFGGGGGAAAAGLVSGSGNILGLASNASSAYNLATGSFGSMLFGNAAAYSAMTPGLALGGQQAAMLAAQTGEFGLAGATATAQAGGAGLGGFGALLSNPLAIAGGALLLGNALGLFRTTERRGGGLIGTLGEAGGVHDADLMRKSGTLFGGPDWFVEDRGRSALDKAIQAQFTASKEAIKGFAQGLGLATDKIEGFSSVLGTETLGDHGQLGIRLDNNGQPLSDAEVQAKITAAIKNADNQLAEQLIGTWQETTREVTETVKTGFWDDLKETTRTRTVTDRTYTPSEFARDGEQAIDTLTRLGTSIAAVNTTFETLGMALLDASLAGGAAASSFIDLFGTLENFNAAIGTYYQNFYSGDERRQKQKADLDKMFKEYGLDPIDMDAADARAQYRTLVEREQGRMAEEESAKQALKQTFKDGLSGLPDLADMSGQALDDALRAALGPGEQISEEAQGKLKGLFADFDAGKLNIDQLSGSVADLVAPITGTGKSAAETTAALLQASGAFAAVTTSAEDAAAAQTAAHKSATDAAWRAMQQSIAAAREAAQAEITLRQQRLQTAQAIVELTRDQARELRGLVDSTIAMTTAQANAWIDSALTAARSGQLPEAQALRRAVEDARAGMDTSAYANRLDYEAAQLILANKLDAIGDSGQAQVDVNELLLEQAKKEVDRLELLLKAGQAALDEARGNTAAVQGVESAVRAFYDRLFEEQNSNEVVGGGDGASGGNAGPTFGPGDPGGASSNISSKYTTPVGGYTGGTIYAGVSLEQEKRLDKYAAGYHAFDGTGDAEGLNQYIIDNKLTPEDMSGLSGLYKRDWEDWYKTHGIPAFASGGGHAGGLRLVGEDGPELEVTGPARIYNSQQTQQLLAGLQGGGNAEVVAAIQALQRQGYDIGRTLIVLLQSVETLARKQDAIGVLQREVVA
ncbi:MAG: hypothetical protein LT082_08960 [Comamonas sp.]|nr:hypothetical protein [Comamonas sp.]